MQNNPPAPHSFPASPQPAADLWLYAEKCIAQTAEVLHEAHAASTAEIQHAIQLARSRHAAQRPADLLECLLRVQGCEEEHFSQRFLDLSARVSAALFHPVPLIPFAGKLIAPSSFYEAFEQVHKVARILLCPVIYTEDTDCIGVASINPIACAILAEIIENNVKKRFGIQPFLSQARLDYESWTFLIRKHFEL